MPKITNEEIEALKLQCANMCNMPFLLNGVLQRALDRLVELEAAVAWTDFTWETVPDHNSEVEILTVDGVIYRSLCDIRWVRSDSVPKGARWRYPVGDLS